MNKQYFILNQRTSREKAALACMTAENNTIVFITDQNRTTRQNSLLWRLLSDISEQVNWHGNKLEPEEWKDVFTASLKKQKVVPGIDGGFVVCGQSTSKMNKEEFSDLMELMYAFASQQGVDV